MKIDRRSFLGLGLGAAAGATVAPMTWKITDDLSIWTQNWPWTPVPKDGEVTYDNTVCSLCPGHCGLSVRKIDGRPVKIEGRAGYPVNDGSVCLHGISSLQYLFDPSRIKTPLKKTDTGFEAISWEEAVSLVKEKLTALRTEGKADKIACVSGADSGSVAGLFERFLKALGSNNYLTMDSMEKSWALTLEKMHAQRVNPGFDLANADFILSFGCGLIEGWGSPVNNFKINASRKDRSASLVQVEPRLSNTAAAADTWLPAKPGTEGDLALGVASVIISEKLFNSVAVVGSKDFKAFAAMVQEKYSPEAVAETTGIPASKIKTLAKKFAGAKASIAIAGRGRGTSAGSIREFAAVHALNCLVGGINRTGGVWPKAPQGYDQWPVMEMDDIAKAGLGKEAVNAAGSVSGLFAQVASSDETPVEALLIYQANPCYSLTNAGAVAKALEKIPFVVSFSSYMDETADQADVILPSHMFLERVEDVRGSLGMTTPITALSRPVAGPLFDTRNPGDAVILLAKAMEGTVAASFPWESYEECLEAVTGDMWETLSQEGFVADADKTPSRFETVDFSFFAGDPTGIQVEMDSSFPLTLVPVDNMRLAAGDVAASPFAVKTVSDKVLLKRDTLVEINPETARGYKLSHGDKAVITTPVGEAKVLVNLSDGIMPGVVAMVRGLGHEMGANKFIGGKGVNVNELMGPAMDAASGLDAAWGIKAKIARA